MRRNKLGFDLLNGLMFHRLQGPIFVFLLFITSLLGAVFIIFPFVPLAYFYPKAWRFCADRFVGYWLTFPASLVEMVFGCQFHVTGDVIRRNEPAIIIMNHRTRLDWMFLWNALYKMDPYLLMSEKISLKAPLKRIPGAGWAMSSASFIFLERNFEADKPTIEKMIDYYAEAGGSYQLLLFPEGTDRGKRAMGLSDAFADKNSLPRYEQVLHPRTTGFNYLVDLMHKKKYINCVYDITLAYGDNIVESELELFSSGEFPKSAHFDVKRYSIDEIPEKTEERSKWLNSLWETKEEKLKKFYESTRKLEPSGERYVWPVSINGIGYYITFIFWILSSFMWIYFIHSYLLVKLYTLSAICFYIYCLRQHNGVEFLVLNWFYRSS